MYLTSLYPVIIHYLQDLNMRTGWWFGTWLLFFPSYWYTTNQRIYLFWMSGWSPHWDGNNSHLVIPKGWEKWQLFHNHFGIINNDDLVFYSSFCAESELSIMENRDSNGPNHLNILMFGNSRIGGSAAADICRHKLTWWIQPKRALDCSWGRVPFHSWGSNEEQIGPCFFV